MCLIVLALDQHPFFPVVLATNRDEFHGRPTEPMHWWPQRPLLAGRDQRSGGTWLGIRPDGSLALVTNYRSGTAEPEKLSRGGIPLDLLSQTIAPERLRRLYQQRRQYSGFNLIASDGSNWFYSGSEDRIPLRRLFRGLYGLSNHLLQSNWPKVQLARQLVETSIEEATPDAAALHRSLIERFRDTRTAADGLLPETGVGLELERLLSPLFIHGERYGTRATSVVTIDREGRVRVTEQRYGPMGAVEECQSFAWEREGSGHRDG